MTAPTRDDLIERARKEVPGCDYGPEQVRRPWGNTCDNLDSGPCGKHAAIARALADYGNERLEAAAVKARHRHTKKCIRLAEPADPRDDVGACTCTSEDIRCAILELKSRPVEESAVEELQRQQDEREDRHGDLDYGDRDDHPARPRP